MHVLGHVLAFNYENSLTLLCEVLNDCTCLLKAFLSLCSSAGVIRALQLKLGTDRRVVMLGWSMLSSDVRIRAVLGIFYHGVAGKSRFSRSGSLTANLVN